MYGGWRLHLGGRSDDLSGGLNLCDKVLFVVSHVNLYSYKETVRTRSNLTVLHPLSLGISCAFCSLVNTTVVSRKPTHEYLLACHLQHCPRWPGEH